MIGCLFPFIVYEKNRIFMFVISAIYVFILTKFAISKEE